ncbi:MAG: phosphotransferase family protein, partial [Burkholderiales bacterium]
LGRTVDVVDVRRVGGGASKQAWAVDVIDAGRLRPLFVRRAGATGLHAHTLPIAQEHAVILAAHAAGVPVPRPMGNVVDVDGRDAFVAERIDAEGLGRRIVRLDTLAVARERLPLQMADALAAIHRIEVDALPLGADKAVSDASVRVVSRLEQALDAAREPHPAIEAGLSWLRRRRADAGTTPDAPRVLVHGDFRIGNLLVDRDGLRAVIDWEFAHLGHPLEDLAWPLVRAWRFGRDALRCGGVGHAEAYLERYNRASGRSFTARHLAWWEVAGNVRWAISCLTQARRHLEGGEPDVELAVLGRLASEVEHEILALTQGGDDAGPA